MKGSVKVFLVLFLLNFLLTLAANALLHVPSLTAIVLETVLFGATAAAFFFVVRKPAADKESGASSAAETAVAASSDDYREAAIQAVSVADHAAAKASFAIGMDYPGMAVSMSASIEDIRAAAVKIAFFLSDPAFDSKPAIAVGETIQEIYHRIPLLRQLLDSIVNKTETAAMDLIDKFGIVQQENSRAASDAEKNLASLEKSEGNKSFEEMIVSSRDAIDRNTELIKKMLNMSNLNRERLSKVGSWIDQINAIMANIENISQQNKVISLNSFIESAKLGEQGKGLKVLAREIEKLSKMTAEFTKEISSIMVSFRKYNDGMIRDFSQSNDEFTGSLSEAGDFLGEMVRTLIRSYKHTSESFMKLRESTNNVKGSLKSISSSLQFQDITRQQIEHVAVFLEDMKKKIDADKKGLLALGVDLDDETNHVNLKIRNEMKKTVSVNDERQILK